MNRICSTCETEKSFTEFPSVGRRCKRCVYEKMLDWRRNNKDRVAATRKRWLERHPGRIKELGTKSAMKLRYGITPECYAALLKSQGESCAICGTQNNPKRRLCIDHAHDDDHVRGLLCDKCNVGLGAFGDRPDLLIAAAEYLRRKSSQP